MRRVVGLVLVLSVGLWAPGGPASAGVVSSAEDLVGVGVPGDSAVGLPPEREAELRRILDWSPCRVDHAPDDTVRAGELGLDCDYVRELAASVSLGPEGVASPSYEWSDMGPNEIAVCGYFLAACYAARYTKRDAWSASNGGFGLGERGVYGPGNAMRHAYWNALMVMRSRNLAFAHAMGDAHEVDHGGGSPDDTWADLHNNEQGCLAGEQWGSGYFGELIARFVFLVKSYFGDYILKGIQRVGCGVYIMYDLAFFYRV